MTLPRDAELRTVLAHWRDRVGPDTAQFTEISGGLSGARIWQVATPGKPYCLRRWPTHHPSPQQLDTMHALLGHLAVGGLGLTPQVQRTTAGTTWVSLGEHLWELTTWLRGAPLTADGQPEDQQLAALEALAGIHRAAQGFALPPGTKQHGPSPGLQTRLAMLTDLRQGAFADLAEAVQRHADSPRYEAGKELVSSVGRHLEWVHTLLQRQAHRALPLQWCLRDVHRGNLLFDRSQVTGVVDFATIGVDSVAGDVARLVGSLVEGNLRTWQPSLTAYQRVGGLSEQEIAAVVLFHTAGVLCGAANWLRWLFEEQRSFAAHPTVAQRLASLNRQLQGLGSFC